MHMVWHDAPRKEPIAFLIEVTQGVGHFFCDSGVLQMTSARTAVEEAFNHWGRETRDSRAFIGAEVAPKTDSSLDDGLALGFDAIKNGLGKRIGQTEGEEVGGAVFFPMGEPAAIVNFDLAKAGAGRPHDSRRDAGATVARCCAWCCSAAVLGGCRAGVSPARWLRRQTDCGLGSGFHYLSSVSLERSAIASSASSTGDEIT